MSTRKYRYGSAQTITTRLSRELGAPGSFSVAGSVGHGTNGSQRVKWLASVGIARWDEDGQNQGWRRLGVPTAVELMDTGFEIEMSQPISKVLKNNEHINVKTSLNPSETR